MAQQYWNRYSDFLRNVHILYRSEKALSKTLAFECNCYEFGKYFKCKHHIGLCILLNLIQVPKELKHRPLTNKKKKRA